MPVARAASLRACSRGGVLWWRHGRGVSSGEKGMAREGTDERRRNEIADSKVEPSTVAAAAAASSPKLSSKKVLLSDIMLGKSSSSAPATAASSSRLVFVGQKAGEYGTAENGAGCNINGNRTSEGLLVHQACIVLRGVLAPGAALCSAQRPRVDLAMSLARVRLILFLRFRSCCSAAHSVLPIRHKSR